MKTVTSLYKARNRFVAAGGCSFGVIKSRQNPGEFRALVTLVIGYRSAGPRVTGLPGAGDLSSARVAGSR
jgi:hypothetical protein